ncbi:hypothetical protein OSCI_2920018 [Kamptonema sp. PCC 6506]|nr:hypothetical protein OSCI_2920018 [Kamptonema sp. PCC 6506]
MFYAIALTHLINYQNFSDSHSSFLGITRPRVINHYPKVHPPSTKNQDLPTSRSETGFLCRYLVENQVFF